MSAYPATIKDRAQTSQLIRMTRAALGLTQGEFGNRYHYTAGAVGAWEKGTSLPPMSVRRDCIEIMKEAVRASIRLENDIQKYFGEMYANRRTE